MKRSLAKRQARRAASVASLDAAPPDPARYQEWLQFYFARASDNVDPWSLDWEFKATPSELAVLTATGFERSATDLALYTEVEVAAGLEALLGGNLSNSPHRLAGRDVGEATKRRLIRSLRPLYLDCLAPRSAPTLGHQRSDLRSPLSFITYMLWDISPLERLIGVREPENGPSLLIDVLAKVLMHRPANPACLEGVLHGFGHMVLSHAIHREQIRRAIAGFLPLAPPDLVDYAHAAAAGCVQ